MGKIIILDENTSNKIAAGEVIERPASIIKELIENSIDASADIISVEIKNGGISYIKVTDNGSGIEEDDTEIAFERHATSKIRSSNDLEKIETLGFRGEALASIAAVSSVELTTRVANKTQGSLIRIKGGNLIDVRKTGCPAGTTFVIRELFYNTPARFKFLKKDTTEAGYISDVVGRIALGNPNISFRLSSSGSTVIHTPGNGDLLSVIYSIYGKETAKNSIEIKYQDQYVKIHGYAGKQEIARSNRNQQSLFVNGRYIKSRTVASSIDEAYKTFLMKNKYPFIVLFIDINPMLVDVNVHPTKMEIRFSDEQQIFRSVYHAVNNALLTGQNFKEINITTTHSNSFKMPENTYESVKYEQENLGSRASIIAEKAAVSYTPDIFQNRNIVQTPRNNNIIIETDKNTLNESVYNKQPDEEPKIQEEVKQRTTAAERLDNARIVGQVFSTYIILQQGDDMLAIDQHAAHERITYEGLKKKYADNQSLAQYLLKPEVVELTHQELKTVEENSELLEKLGFILEEFGSGSVLLRAVPVNDLGLIKELFLQIIDEIYTRKNYEETKRVDDLLYTVACKAAVKANRRLEESEIKSILKELGNIENPFTCPHGRPTVIKISKKDFEKMFKRIV
ncbi:MAG: DNA mismatch repair endonuclease MutL [Bacillota bacterium]|nr:DNA mismatch repair endonuclease MutL [Bacillota bacterium]